jgi:hypothetical protein
MNLRKTICATILFSACGLFAAPNYWINPGQGQFNDPANWSSNSVPAGSDDARVNNGGTAIIDSSMTLSMSLLQIADTNTTTGTVRMTGGSLTLSSDLRSGGNAASGGGTGVFQLEGGSVLLTGNLNVGFGTNNANGTYNIFGGSLQCNAANPIFAVGNRGTGTINHTNGTVYLRNNTGFTQLGRNVANGTAFGTYNLSGGTLACGRVLFGNAVQTNGISTNTFTLSGTGVVICNGISNINTTAVNTFNFNGGTLTFTNSSVSITNNGGVLSPGTPDFANANATNINSLPVNPVGTATFTGATTYFQNANSTLAIDIGSATAYDSVNIPLAGSAVLHGTIVVNFINFVPDLNSTFDIVTAGTVVSDATVVAANGAAFNTSIVTAGDGRQVLRLTLTTQPFTPVQLSIAAGPSAVQINFTNTPGHNNFTVVDANIVTSPFAILGTATEVTPGNYQFIDNYSVGVAQRYYQVRHP